MTVRELIALLEKLPQSAQVVLSKDGEGNSFSPLADHSVGRYEPTSTSRGDFRSEMEPGQRKNAVCLWPTS